MKYKVVAVLLVIVLVVVWSIFSLVEGVKDDNIKYESGMLSYRIGEYERAMSAWDGLERYRWDVAEKFAKIYFFGLLGQRDVGKAKKYLSKFSNKYKDKVGYMMALILIDEGALKNGAEIEDYLEASSKYTKESGFLLAMHRIAFGDISDYLSMLDDGFYGDVFFKKGGGKIEQSNNFYTGIHLGYLGLNAEISKVIGEAFYSGQIVDQNIEFAYYWFLRAAELSNSDGKYYLYLINMSPSGWPVLNCVLANRYLKELESIGYFEGDNETKFKEYCVRDL